MMLYNSKFLSGNQVSNPIDFIFLIHFSTWLAFFHWKLEKNDTFIPHLKYSLQKILNQKNIEI